MRNEQPFLKLLVQKQANNYIPKEKEILVLVSKVEIGFLSCPARRIKCLGLFIGQVRSPHHSDQMSKNSVLYGRDFCWDFLNI